MTGATAREIAADIGISVSRVRGYIARLVSAGEIPRVALRRKPVANAVGKRPTRALAYKFSARFGRIDEMFAQLTPSQSAWLVKQIPPDGLLVDVLRAIVIDAYNDDHP